jgi:hypothetical protein
MTKFQEYKLLARWVLHKHAQAWRKMIDRAKKEQGAKYRVTLTFHSELHTKPDKVVLYLREFLPPTTGAEDPRGTGRYLMAWDVTDLDYQCAVTPPNERVLIA